MASATEAPARIKVNTLLESAGWRFLDEAKGKVNLALEPVVKLSHDQNEIADSEIHVEMNVLHEHDLSRKDIEACLACDLSAFEASPFCGEVQALMQVLQTKAEP